MRKSFRWALAAVALLSTASFAATPTTPNEVIAAARASEWARFDPASLLVLDLAASRRVVIALASDFAPEHVANIRILARNGWFDRSFVVRVQDNYVVQWGGADDKKPLPPGIKAGLPAEYDRPASGLQLTKLQHRDSFAPVVGLHDAFPVAEAAGRAWAPHCYGMVGVGRDLSPDTGSGAELYAVIGHAPRALDRNIAVVGRVLAGFEHLTSLPRGEGNLGFYTDPKQRVPITRVRLAADMPPAERPAFEWLRPESDSFALWVHLRANRRDSFFIRPAGAVDLCNALPPVRSVPQG
jgi:peptidylprolyl isomerase